MAIPRPARPVVFSFSANPSQKSGAVHIVTALRGLAALAVCWYHVVNDVYPLLKGSSIAYLGSFGWVGVEAFFVISGFVIPYALTMSNYSVRRLPHFLLRRIVRIDPPYLLSIGLTMLIAVAAAITPGYRGAPPHYTVTQILAHLGYITNFAGGQINRAYWTLGIEFQYYLLIGLACCFVIRCGRSSYYAILAGGLILDHCLSMTPVEPKYVISHWMPLFLLGVLAASHRLNLMPPRHIGEWLLAAWLSLRASLCWMLKSICTLSETSIGTAKLSRTTKSTSGFFRWRFHTATAW